MQTEVFSVMGLWPVPGLDSIFAPSRQSCVALAAVRVSDHIPSSCTVPSSLSCSITVASGPPYPSEAWSGCASFPPGLPLGSSAFRADWFVPSRCSSCGSPSASSSRLLCTALRPLCKRGMFRYDILWHVCSTVVFSALSLRLIGRLSRSCDSLVFSLDSRVSCV